MAEARPLVILAPEPRRLEEIFTPAARARLEAGYALHRAVPDAVRDLPDAVLGAARYIIGQPPLPAAAIARAVSLRAIFNVESNLQDNMDYAACFARGIHVLTTGPVFAEPVAEIGLGFALALARDIVEADLAFREGRERWGFEGNREARLLGGSEIGLIGFGDLGRALLRLLAGFRARIRIFDPWLADATVREAGGEPAPLDRVLAESDTVFVVAAVTTENRGFLGRREFALMRPGAAFVLLSRAAVVDWEAMVAAVRSGHIRAASDVFPVEPVAPDDPVRRLPGFLRSAHRAGALDRVMLEMGERVLDDMGLLDRGLPPQRCKRAERETAGRMRSMPIART
jgi:phosphoglycerate dehydrogenase-like enzyme